MKVLSIIAVLCFGIFTQSSAQELAYKTIKVWGNCGMCKETIEKSALKAGAATADWSEESKELKVSFDAKKTSSEKIQKRIARSGYDTQDFVAPDKAYNALHGCCKYDRKADTQKGDSSMNCCKDGKCSKGVKDMADCKKEACCKDAVCCK
ncbi:MAG: hypothetical protein QM687_14925 [Ferruginibacter sp.]